MNLRPASLLPWPVKCSMWWRNSGVSVSPVLLVEQIVVQSLLVGDNGSVLVNGQIALTDTAYEMLARDDLHNVYFGYADVT